MARMPGAEWVGPHHDNGTMAKYDIVCLHTIVGTAPAHAAHFSTRGDGHIYQSRDTAFRSAANLDGNYRVIAIENADRDGAFSPWNTNDGHAVPAFTAQQIEAIARICSWAYFTHGIPLVACPDSRPGSKGIAYHRQGISGNWAGYYYDGVVPGGEVWTASSGKVCPGDRRIAQVPQIIARAREIAGLSVVQRKEDMTVRLVRGDSTTQVPGKSYAYGNLLFMVLFDPNYEAGAERKYMVAGPAQRILQKIQGGIDVVDQSDLDNIPFAPGGEIPENVLH